MKRRVMCITQLELMSVIVAVATGARFMTTPREVADVALNDGWLSVVAAGCLITLSTLLIVRMCRIFPQQTIAQFSQAVWGKTGGKVFNLALILVLILLTSTELRRVSAVLKIFLLNDTPLEVIVLLLMSSCIFLVQHEMSAITRFSQIMLYGANMPLIFLTLCCFEPARASEIKPILGNGPGPVMHGILPALYAFTGPELAVAFFYPFVRNQGKTYSSVLIGMFLSILTLTMVAAACIMVFSAEELHYIIYPAVSIFKSIDLMKLVLERLESLMLTVWIPLTYVAQVIMMYAMASALATTFQVEEHRTMVWLIAPFIVVLSLIAPDSLSSFAIIKGVEWVCLFFSILILPAMAGIAYIRCGKEQEVDVCASEKQP